MNIITPSYICTRTDEFETKLNALEHLIDDLRNQVLYCAGQAKDFALQLEEDISNFDLRRELSDLRNDIEDLRDLADEQREAELAAKDEAILKAAIGDERRVA